MYRYYSSSAVTQSFWNGKLASPSLRQARVTSEVRVTSAAFAAWGMGPGRVWNQLLFVWRVGGSPTRAKSAGDWVSCAQGCGNWPGKDTPLPFTKTSQDLWHFSLSNSDFWFSRLCWALSPLSPFLMSEVSISALTHLQRPNSWLLEGSFYLPAPWLSCFSRNALSDQPDPTSQYNTEGWYNKVVPHRKMCSWQWKCFHLQW